MRKFYFLLICLFTFGILSAQEELSKEEKERREKNIQAANPFAKFGYKAKVATLSKGKYLEVHDLDSIVTIGSVRFHVDKQDIVGYIEQDTTEYAKPLGDTPSRWLSVDPLAEEFPDWSPYTFVYNNPIKFIDPDGRAAIDHIEVDENNKIVGGKRDDDLNIYRVKKNADGKYERTGDIVGQLSDKNQGFIYNEQGGFKGPAYGAKLHTSFIKGYPNGKQLLNSLNRQFESEIQGNAGYMPALAELAIDSRGPSGLGPFKGSANMT